jgi:DNA-binding response OmpR family regulator
VKILIVEDDEALANMLVEMMTQVGYTPRRFASGAMAITEFAAFNPDLVLLDLNLPDLDGHEVCRRIRTFSEVPVIMLTARDAELDRVLGLEEGADDYVVKPFSSRELLARIRAVRRRTQAGLSLDHSTAEGAVAIDEAKRLWIDRRTRRVTLDGEEVQFTAKEFDVLAYLASDPDAVRERHEIMEHVWDTHWYGPTKTLDAHVAAIRKKLGDSNWIEAVRGVGFRLRSKE